jgi:hypothetical protein
LPPTSAPAKSVSTETAQHNQAAAHLRSAKAVNGYHIKASDGLMGHVSDFMMNDESWAIAQVIIKTGHRFSGKEVQIPTSKVERISYDESTVFVNLTSNAVEKSPTHSIVLVGVPD